MARRRLSRSGWRSSRPPSSVTLGGKLLTFAKDHGGLPAMSEQIAILALALLSYLGAVAIGGNGFVAAFAGGILFGAATSRRLKNRPVHRDARTVRHIPGLVHFRCACSWGNCSPTEFCLRPILYAVLSLTVIRMVPVAIALDRNHLRPAPWRSWAGSARAGWPRSSLRSSPWRSSSTPTGVRCCADRHLDHPALRGAARHLRLAAGRPLRRLDRQGRRRPENVPAGEPRLRLHERGSIAQEGAGDEELPVPRPSADGGSGADSGAPACRTPLARRGALGASASINRDG